MSTKSQEVGAALLHGIDTLESGAHDSVHAGANTARTATKIGSRWAAGQETHALQKARELKRDLRKQSAQLKRRMNESVEMVGDTARSSALSTRKYVKQNPWKALAMASGAALLIGALLGRRR
jgi:ElaB/YqjD/DUF883 family membrane-anchored ribosome-binding protein